MVTAKHAARRGPDWLMIGCLIGMVACVLAFVAVLALVRWATA